MKYSNLIPLGEGGFQLEEGCRQGRAEEYEALVIEVACSEIGLAAEKFKLFLCLLIPNSRIVSATKSLAKTPTTEGTAMKPASFSDKAQP